MFLKECEDGFHGNKDVGTLHSLPDNRFHGSDYSASVATTVSRRLRSYLPSKRRLPPPIEKCAPSLPQARRRAALRGALRCFALFLSSSHSALPALCSCCAFLCCVGACGSRMGRNTRQQDG